MKKKQKNGQPSEMISDQEETLLDELFPIVGIGASAGGIEAITKMLENLPSDLGSAYVVIQHLSPTHESILPEVLQHHTAMPVAEVVQDMVLEKDKVYVIPPNYNLGIKGKRLKLIKREPSQVVAQQVDFFFKELATEYKSKAVGVILSGTATDGTIGLKAIKSEGGVSFAQDGSAQFHGMPDSAVRAGHADIVLSPEKIAEQLSALFKGPISISSSEKILAAGESDIIKIITALNHHYQVDFFSYKQTTIKRRILRRMFLNRFRSLGEYRQYLTENSRELDALFQDLLINVTEFFRDESIYTTLSKKILPELVKERKNDDTLRIWIPGCSTGEEAYSFAITLLEFLGNRALTIPIQVFGTDLDEQAIEKARCGIYAKASMKNVSVARMEKFFTKIDGSYQVVKTVRDICIFAPHNIMRDPPFSRIDIVSCQNLLIYVETNAQKNILDAFYYALKPSGYLLLGKSETIGSASDIFEQADRNVKMYSKKAISHYPHFNFSIRSKAPIPSSAETGQRSVAVEPPLEKEMDKLLLSRFVPATVVINKDLEILHFRGNTAQFLQPSSGKATLHVLKMVRDELVFDVRSLVSKVKKEGKAVKKEGILLPVHDQIRQVTIDVLPVSPGRDVCYMIIFRDTPVIEAGIKTNGRKTRESSFLDQRIASLENDLREARENMKAMNEEFEATREELQSANEEVLSSNEELQSINEELETSKEELQSTNEELTTINEELLHRNEDLRQEKDYSTAIVNTIKEPLVVLTHDLRIRTANKAFYEFFRLSAEETEGYYLNDIGAGDWKIPEFNKQLGEIFSGTKRFKNFEISKTFHGIGEKVILINAMSMSGALAKDDKILIAIEDITERKKSEKELRELGKFHGDILNSISDVFVSTDKNGHLTYINKKAELLLETTADDALGRQLWEVYPYYQNTVIESSVKQSFASQLSADFEFFHPKPRRWFYYRLYPSHDGISIYATDISERKEVQEMLIQSEERYKAFLTQSSEGIWRFELDAPMPVNISPNAQVDFLYANAFLEESNDAMAIMYGYNTAEEIKGTRIHQLLPRNEINEQYLLQFIQSGYRLSEALSSETTRDGHVKYFLNNLLGIVEDGLVKRAWGTQRDVTEQKLAEEKLKESEERFRLLIQNSFDIITIFDERGTVVYQSPSIKTILGYDPEERINRNLLTDPLVHPDDMHLKERMIRDAVAYPQQTIRTEFRLKHKGGGYRSFEAVCVNLLSDNRIRGIVANYRDITERKKLEHQKEEFIGIASHELKTPVTSIKAYMEILHQHFEESKDSYSANLIAKVEGQVNRLTKLIVDLLDVTKISGGQLMFRKEEFDCNEMVAEIVEEMQRTTSKHTIVLELANPVKVTADRDRTGQVLTNFISNAIKYSPEGGRIIVKTENVDDKQVTISVQDFGIGMSEEMQKKVFERFFRVEEKAANTYPGLGLGLYIAAEIVKRQGGDIWLASEKGKGSTFYFRLPVSHPG